jgi:hypothetical protein
MTLAGMMTMPSGWTGRPAMTDEVAKPRTDLLAVGLIEKCCQDVGCAVNKAFDDQHGWDLIVEFPVLAHAGPADKRPPALKCFVQVKSTQSDKTSVTIKLSNALKLAQNPLPCFTALVVYAEDGKTQIAIYLQHFDKAQIDQALKAARQAHADGENELHKRHVTLRFAPEEATAQDQVACRMAQAVPTPATYAAAKHARTEGAGYEDGHGKGKLSLSHEHFDAFVDALLGKDVTVPVKNMSVHEQRFGILNPDVLFEGPGKIQITPKPIKDCRVIVRLPATDDQIVLPGEIFVPGIPNLPEEYRKFRVHTDLLQFTCARGEGHNVAFGDFTASFGTEERTNIDQLDQMAALWSWFEAGPLEIELWVDGARLLRGQIETKTDKDQGYWWVLRRITHTLANFVDKDMRPVPLEYALWDFWPLTRLVEFAEVIGGAKVKARFSIQGNFPAELRSYVTPVILEFGPVVFIAVVRYRVTQAVLGEGSVTVELVEPSILRKAILRGTLADNAEFVREETRAVERSCAKDGEETVFVFLPEVLTPTENG